MVGPVVIPTGVSGNANTASTAAGGEHQNSGFSFSASELNSLRVASDIDNLFLHVRGARKTDSGDFLRHCISLASGIDLAIANHELPSRYMELPLLIKMVCQNIKDVYHLATIMVLMISIKSACQNEWFSSKESEELMNLAKQIGNNFCGASNFNTEPSCSFSVIPSIFTRFFPRMSMGHVFASIEVKPGFDAYVTDFQIPMDFKLSSGDKIRLLVAQTDNIETSSCLITPAKVNFLLNGKPVEGRTSLNMDLGPQIPTDLSFLKDGSNLLQAVGEFNGNYIIAVALMSEIPNPECSGLQDYKPRFDTATMDSDSEVILRASRISLNCPISFKRINTPVKGHSCNHIQCFDFNNFVDINSRRPSWRCPHCNQHVCINDLRIDRKMVKILEEIGTDISGIIISLDGSWKPVMESDNTEDKQEDESFSMGQDQPLQPADILDLTKTDDVIYCGTEDSKPVPANQRFMGQSTGHNPYPANINSIGAEILNGFGSVPTVPSFGLSGGSSNVLPNTQAVGTSFPPNPCTSPNTEAAFYGINLAQQGGIYLPTAIQLQQYQNLNPSINNELVRFPATARNVTRIPNPAQTLPDQTLNSMPQRTFRSSSTSFNPNSSSAASQVSPSVPNTPGAAHRQSLSHVLYPPCIQQNTVPRARQHRQNATVQNPSPAPNQYRVSTEKHSSSQQMGNLTASRSIGPSAGLNQSPILSPRGFSASQSRTGISADRSVHTTSTTSSQQAQLIAAANRSVQMAAPLRITPSFLRNSDGSNMQSPVDQRGNSRVAPSQSVPRTDAFDPNGMNWRPAARMRGALSGEAYTNAFNEYIIRPSQQSQVARPISNATNFQPQLQGFRTGQGTTPPSYPSGGQANRPGG